MAGVLQMTMSPASVMADMEITKKETLKKPAVTFIIGNGPNLIKASIDRELGPRFKDAMIVGIRSESKTIRLTQLIMKAPISYLPKIRSKAETINVKMWFWGRKAGTKEDPINILNIISESWYKNWIPGQDWYYNGILEFEDTCLILELETTPGPFTLSIFGPKIVRHISWPKDQTNHKEAEDHE